MKSQKWRDKLEDKSLTLAQFESALDEWDKEISDLNTSADIAADKDAGKISELEDKLAEVQAGPDWGNCRRGCPPAYLNRNGFCSPACELGAPRGEFVTITTKLTGYSTGLGDWTNL